MNNPLDSELREAIEYRVREEYKKYHNDHTTKWNGKDFWIEQIVWKLGESIEAYIHTHTLEAEEQLLDELASKVGWYSQQFNEKARTEGVEDTLVPLSVIEAKRTELSAIKENKE